MDSFRSRNIVCLWRTGWLSASCGEEWVSFLLLQLFQCREWGFPFFPLLQLNGNAPPPFAAATHTHMHMLQGPMAAYSTLLAKTQVCSCVCVQSCVCALEVPVDQSVGDWIGLGETGKWVISRRGTGQFQNHQTTQNTCWGQHTHSDLHLHVLITSVTEHIDQKLLIYDLWPLIQHVLICIFAWLSEPLCSEDVLHESPVELSKS